MEELDDYPLLVAYFHGLNAIPCDENPAVSEELGVPWNPDRYHSHVASGQEVARLLRLYEQVDSPDTISDGVLAPELV